MFVEKRTYTFKPRGVATHMKIYEEFGLETQTRILGQPFGWFYSEFGELNQVVHMWTYNSLDERTQKRAQMGADPGWKKFQQETDKAGVLLTQETQLLIPAPWSPPLK